MKHARDDYNDIVALDKKIPADEPVFLLRGQDAVAAAVVRVYASLLEVADPTNPLIASARAQADLMDAWPTKKLPNAAKKDA